MQRFQVSQSPCGTAHLINCNSVCSVRHMSDKCKNTSPSVKQPSECVRTRQNVLIHEDMYTPTHTLSVQTIITGCRCSAVKVSLQQNVRDQQDQDQDQDERAKKNCPRQRHNKDRYTVPVTFCLKTPPAAITHSGTILAQIILSFLVRWLHLFPSFYQLTGYTGIYCR